MYKEELIWLDKDDNIVDSADEAVRGVIRELNDKGELIQETWLMPEKD